MNVKNVERKIQDLEKERLKITTLTEREMKDFLFLFSYGMYGRYFLYESDYGKFVRIDVPKHSGRITIITGTDYETRYRNKEDTIPDIILIKEAFIERCETLLEKKSQEIVEAQRILNLLRQLKGKN
jgi:hypothetical protein